MAANVPESAASKTIRWVLKQRSGCMLRPQRNTNAAFNKCVYDEALSKRPLEMETGSRRFMWKHNWWSCHCIFTAKASAPSRASWERVAFIEYVCWLSPTSNEIFSSYAILLFLEMVYIRLPLVCFHVAKHSLLFLFKILFQLSHLVGLHCCSSSILFSVLLLNQWCCCTE